MKSNNETIFIKMKKTANGKTGAINMAITADSVSEGYAMETLREMYRAMLAYNGEPESDEEALNKSAQESIVTPKQLETQGLAATIEDMVSSNYKKRFLAEYRQLEIRMKGLRRMLDKYAAGELDFKPTCSYDLLHKQYVHMADYLDDLNLRAVYEGIDVHGDAQV